VHSVLLPGSGDKFALNYPYPRSLFWHLCKKAVLGSEEEMMDEEQPGS